MARQNTERKIQLKSKGQRRTKQRSRSNLIKQYKLRELNKNPLMHKRVFVTYEDCLEALEKLYDIAIDCGANGYDLLLKVQNKHGEKFKEDEDD